MRILLLFPFLSLGLVAADENIYLSATATEDLVAKEGQIVVVHGETKDSGKSAAGTNFVHFVDSEFFLVTFKSDLDQFSEGEPHVLYDGRRIAVEGSVSIYQGKPQIKLTSPEQITILEPDTEFPPKAAEVEMAEAKPEAASKDEEKDPKKKSEPEPEKRKPPVDPSEFFK